MKKPQKMSHQNIRGIKNTGDNVAAPTLSVIIPAYNEESTVEELLQQVVEVGIDKEVIIIDDCSTDSTLEKIEAFSANNPHARITILKHDRNMGKTASVSDGIAASCGTMVVIQDADLEYDPSDYPGLALPILEGRADVVYGSRFLGGRNRVYGLVGRLHKLVNKFLTFLSNLATGLHLSDMETCYKMVRRDYLRGIKIKSTGFGFEVEITAKLARRGARIREVPILYRGRNYHAGKKIGASDGLAALWWILRFALLG